MLLVSGYSIRQTGGRPCDRSQGEQGNVCRGPGIRVGALGPGLWET